MEQQNPPSSPIMEQQNPPSPPINQQENPPSPPIKQQQNPSSSPIKQQQNPSIPPPPDNQLIPNRTTKISRFSTAIAYQNVGVKGWGRAGFVER
ncbi:hypothetical protein [Coleofasciculus sp. E1-EBD-02]|uniref:hypothetical protein n=1 Tax=Coleofasciculus sp. E1-EBD-02 TaxID=3068481 RepID=UPI00406377C8